MAELAEHLYMLNTKKCIYFGDKDTSTCFRRKP